MSGYVPPCHLDSLNSPVLPFNINSEKECEFTKYLKDNCGFCSDLYSLPSFSGSIFLMMVIGATGMKGLNAT